MRKTKKMKIALIIIISVLVVFFLILMPALTIFVYKQNFGSRFKTPEWMAYSVSDFDGLQVRECTFTSDKGQRLTGYQYSKGDQQIKGVVVMAHGFGGGGHNTYMDVADYFASNGWLVFAYDATGNDKSEGDAVGGLPQGVIDLDYALRYVKQTEEYEGLPIVLFGHSWGGYSVGSVLNFHGDVKAAVLLSGFDRSADLLRQEGASIVGAGINLMMPYFSLYERLKFGKYAACGVLDGFADTDAGILVVHSRDDNVVLPENGYDKFHARYGSDPRFVFIEYKDRGHNDIYYSEAVRNYNKQLNRDYSAYVEANGGVYSAEILTEYMDKYRDNDKCSELDPELMERILRFFDEYCKSPL